MINDIKFFLAEAGCSDVPSGLIPNGNGESFPFSLFETQRLGFHQCDGPMTDGEFAEGTRKLSGKINSNAVGRDS